MPRSGTPLFDRNNPPLDPPSGCLNRLMWQLARRVFTDHQPGSDGWCMSCRPYSYYPCVGRQLANLGLLTAVGQSDDAPLHRIVNNTAYRRVW